jgi:hypothetical protein
MVLQALNFTRLRKPTQLPTVSKISSHPMTVRLQPWTTGGGSSPSSARNCRQQSPERVRPCDLQKLIYSLKMRKACRLDGIPNECLRHLPRRPLVHLTHLFNHCVRLSHFPSSWKEAKIITLPKPGKDPKFPQNLRLISLLSTTGKLII